MTQKLVEFSQIINDIKRDSRDDNDDDDYDEDEFEQDEDTYELENDDEDSNQINIDDIKTHIECLQD